MAASAAASAIFAGLLTLFTWRLFEVGRDQHKAATDALGIARTSADAASENAMAAVAANRAFLFLGISRIEAHTSPGQLKCTVQAENVGSTPGVVKAIYYKVYFAPPTGPVLFEPDGVYTDTDIVFAAHSKSVGWEFVLQPAPPVPYFYGFAVYEDVFRKLRVTRCCLKIDRATRTHEIATDAGREWNEWT